MDMTCFAKLSRNYNKLLTTVSGEGERGERDQLQHTIRHYYNRSNLHYMCVGAGQGLCL